VFIVLKELQLGFCIGFARNQFGFFIDITQAL
jgi:hypothetical protein